MKLSIHHWRYEDGWQDIPAFLVKDSQAKRQFCPETVGWHCWVYPYSDNYLGKEFDEFEQWLATNCPSAAYTRRFNSGNPMITVHIKTAEDAAIFRLTWPV